MRTAQEKFLTHVMSTVVSWLILIPIGGAWANAVGAPLESEVRWSLFITWAVLLVVAILLGFILDDMETQRKKRE